MRPILTLLTFSTLSSILLAAFGDARPSSSLAMYHHHRQTNALSSSQRHRILRFVFHILLQGWVIMWFYIKIHSYAAVISVKGTMKGVAIIRITRSSCIQSESSGGTSWREPPARPVKAADRGTGLAPPDPVPTSSGGAKNPHLKTTPTP